ncbi:VanW family protein [Aestuariimicrobium kwangyangense]|uniref:VanW family protein n=1 Tax=Aestuariimicrobium kwangyangense TaxID=396389 RepID=UPI0003B76DD3|nr:VanW family protein [Aestuariimicrobium kwangyangense]
MTNPHTMASPQAAAGPHAGTATLDLPTRLQVGAPLSERHPWLYPLAVKYHQTRRWIAWQSSGTPWAAEKSEDDLPVKVKHHKSLLLRSLGESEMWLQHNKVTNLRLAAREVDGLVIRPGESFSFNKVVGNCTRRRGFVEGMRLSNGEARPGVGGGICQLANLLHWMVLHSALTVVERSEHSFDPFPDNGRVLPWGVGCSIVWNYVDLVVRNDTESTFRMGVRVGERHLEGELHADREQAFSYRVSARHEEFLKRGDEYFRRNEIWRELIDRRTGDRVGEELVKRNCALVKYLPQGVPIIDADALT